VIGIPIDDLTAGLKHILTWLIDATLAALLLAISWAWHFGGRVAESVKALIEPARALVSGEAVVVPRVHFKEADKLGLALLDAANALQQSDYRAHHCGLTGLANLTLFDACSPGSSRCADATRAGWRFCTSILTTSRPSMTNTVTI